MAADFRLTVDTAVLMAIFLLVLLSILATYIAVSNMAARWRSREREFKEIKRILHDIDSRVPTISKNPRLSSELRLATRQLRLMLVDEEKQ